MIVNGKEVEIAEGLTVLEYLKSEGYCESYVAVERNGEILPKKEYGRAIAADDVFEIVSFVGGG